MGTRAVVHTRGNWIATHWDGHPDSLGADLKDSIKKEISEHTKKFGKESLSWSKPELVERGVWKAAAEHNIDFATTEGQESFDKIYGDFAEYEYDVDSKGNIKVRPLSGEWKRNTKIGEWKKLGKVV